MDELADLVRRRAAALGFDQVGFARADEPLEDDYAHYEDFFDQGWHGEMGYLAAHREVRARLDHEGILAGGKTVICLARRYDRDWSEDEGTVASGIARYARGQDYHRFLRRRLQKLAAFVRERGGQARAMVDTAPVLERAWAARSGLGFVGKNGLIIVPGQGSYCLLGEVVTDLELPAGSYGQPMGERCGRCTACLDACPTDAFAAPYRLEPTRCISYLTIETRGEPPPELADALTGHLFGCDDCQTVCPFNQRRLDPVSDADRMERRRPFITHPRWREVSWRELEGLDEEGFDRLTKGSPLR
ncbi:MAG: tRNA epoxyqueuosine(34) reductase QueG, partial [Myxococcota bacterium]